MEPSSIFAEGTHMDSVMPPEPNDNEGLAVNTTETADTNNMEQTPSNDSLKAGEDEAHNTKDTGLEQSHQNANKDPAEI